MQAKDFTKTFIKKERLVEAENTKSFATIVVRPVAYDRTRVFVRCPYCGDIHIHGISDNAERFGWRGSDCGGKDYMVDFLEPLIKRERRE